MTISDLPQKSRQHTKSFPSKFTQDWTSIREPLFNFLAFLGQRLIFGALVCLFIILLSYLGLEMATGTEFSTAFREAIPNTIIYIDNLLHGDLGSTTAGSETLLPRPVSEVIRERLPRSLGLLGASLVLASVAGIMLGVLAARSRSERSLAIFLASLIGVSIPSFFAAFLLQWLFTTLTRQTGRSILPVGGFGWDAHILLPMLVLAARPIAQITRMTFVSIRQILSQDYIRTAHSKGLQDRQVMAVHVLRNAAIPILTTIGISLRFALSSLPVVELYFGWPGVGVTLLKAIAQQDVNLTIALTLCLGIFFILVNLILELSYRWIDPRLLSKPEHISSHKRSSPRDIFQDFWSGLIDLLTHNFITNFFTRRSTQKLRPSYNLSEIDQNQVFDESPTLYGMRGAWLDLLRNLPLLVGGLLIGGLILLVFIGPQITPNNPLHTQGLVNIDGQLIPPPFPPSETYPWGTDALGRGIMSLIMAGAQQTLILAMLAVAARLLVGIILGALAGWSNGNLLDRMIIGMAEIISAFPTLLAVMILILALGIRQGMKPFIIALCFVGWGEIMQYVRSEVISIRPKLFVESAVAMGTRTLRIIYRHILPNIFAALISITALEMGAVLMMLGELGFISIFIGGGSLIALPSMTILYSDVPEWGALLSNLRYLVRSYPWTGFYPMMAFFVAIFSFNLLGEGVRRMVEQGNLLLNRIFNRYTVILTVVMLWGYNWFSANTGSMPFYRQQAEAFSGEQALAHLSVLSNPRMYGRALGSPGQDLAALYIGINFEKFSLQPGGDKRSFYQERTRGFERLVSEPFLAIEDRMPPPAYSLDFAAYPGKNMTAGQATGPVHFVSLGDQAAVRTPGWSSYYPDLDRVDFKDKILLTLTDREAGYLLHIPKAGLLVVAEDSTQLEQRYTLSGRSGTWRDFSTDEIRGKETPYLWISKETANRILSNSGYSVEKLREYAQEHTMEQVNQIPIETIVSLSVEGTLEEKWPVKNVIGLWPGSVGYDFCADCLGKKLIIVMAQYDSPPIGPEGIYTAANDNGSGIAVMLETIRVLRETDYQPYKSFLFVAYNGEGLDGGEPVNEIDVSKILQANPSFRNFELEALVLLRGLGSTAGEQLEISGEGSLRLAELFEKSAQFMGVKSIRNSENIDIGLIYDEGNTFLKAGQDAPVVRLYWDGWEDTSQRPADTLDNISASNLEEAGRALALSLIILGRETDY